MNQDVTAQIKSLREQSRALECSATLISDARRSIIKANSRAIEALHTKLPFSRDEFDADALLERHLADIVHDLEECREAINTLRKKSPTQFFEIETLRERLLEQDDKERLIKRDSRGAPELTPAQQRTLNEMREEARQDLRDVAELAELRGDG